MKKIITAALIYLLAAGAFFFTLRYIVQESQSYISEDEIVIGKMFLYSYDFELEDPFEKTKIDTVKIVDIKGDYVQYQFTKKSYFMSAKKSLFRRVAKPITNQKQKQ